MKHLITFFLNSDYYEVALNGTTIIRITRYIGDSQTRQELDFDDLSEEAKDKLLDELYGLDT